jgi:hypothetical protein
MRTLLRKAVLEIRELRRTNEVLQAKVDTMQLMSQMLHARAPEHGMMYKEDVVWEIEKKIAFLEDCPEEPNTTGGVHNIPDAVKAV